MIAPVLPSVLTAIMWAASVVFATRSARIMGGSEANFWRLTFATILLGIWAYAFGQGTSGVSFPLFLFSGIIGVGADVFLFQALPRLGSRLSALIIQCGSALFAPMVEWLWLGTRLTSWQILWCLTILVGVAISLAPGKHLSIKRSTLLAGVSFGVLAAIGNGMGAVLTRKGYEVAREAGQHIDDATSAFQRLIGGLFVAGVFLLVARRREVARQIEEPQLRPLPEREKWRRAWPWVLGNALAGQTIGVTCYQWALHTTPTGVVLAIVSTTPIAVIPFAYRFEGERPHFRSILGGVIAVAGVALLLTCR